MFSGSTDMRAEVLPLKKVSIAQRIAQIRKERGYTQQQLAELVGIKRTILADYEVRRIRLYDEMVARFAKALGVSADIILGLDDKIRKREEPDLRITKRLRQISKLSTNDQKALLKNIDMFLKAAQRSSD